MVKGTSKRSKLSRKKSKSRKKKADGISPSMAAMLGLTAAGVGAIGGGLFTSKLGRSTASTTSTCYSSFVAQFDSVFPAYGISVAPAQRAYMLTFFNNEEHMEKELATFKKQMAFRSATVELALEHAFSYKGKHIVTLSPEDVTRLKNDVKLCENLFKKSEKKGSNYVKYFLTEAESKGITTFDGLTDLLTKEAGFSIEPLNPANPALKHPPNPAPKHPPNPAPRHPPNPAPKHRPKRSAQLPPVPQYPPPPEIIPPPPSPSL